MVRLTLIGIVLIFLVIPVSAAQTYTAEVIRVTDGDSMKVKLANGEKKVIRLFGIDAPEMLQKDGPKAGRYLATRVGGEKVTIKELEHDRYGRDIAIVYDKNNKNLNLEMVQMGFAWVYRQYYMHAMWLEFEKAAKEKKIGIWRRKTVQPPWEFRSEKRQEKAR